MENLIKLPEGTTQILIDVDTEDGNHKIDVYGSVEGGVHRLLDVFTLPAPCALGTPPDRQEWGHAYADDTENLNTAVMWRDHLAREGMTFFRITRHEDKIYVDGWKEQPTEMAPFRVIARRRAT